MEIIIIGPAPPLRGGIATFNHRLAREIVAEGHTCSIYSFSLQYPSFLFPGKSQYGDEPPPRDVPIHPVINSINPLNWSAVGNKLNKLRPDIIVVRFWLPFMGPALGTILRKVRKNKHTRVVCIADNIIPHEKRVGDNPFTRYFLKSCDAFIVMSEKVMNDLRSFEKTKPARLVSHPLYDNFGEIVSKVNARLKLEIPVDGRVILFFGFIRKYKGLDILFEAMKIVKDSWQEKQLPLPMPKLLVAGEFYEDKKSYEELIDKLGIRDMLILRTDFIPDSEVKYYLCAADVLIQPYRNATQSGVTPLAYHFERPMIVTNVGGLPELVPHEKTGIVVEPEPASIANGISRFYELGEDFFISHLREEKKQYSWINLVKAITTLAGHE